MLQRLCTIMYTSATSCSPSTSAPAPHERAQAPESGVVCSAQWHISCLSAWHVAPPHAHGSLSDASWACSCCNKWATGRESFELFAPYDILTLMTMAAIMKVASVTSALIALRPQDIECNGARQTLQKLTGLLGRR